MPRQSKVQKETIERVMHAFKEGELESSRGREVKDRMQAIAIALHEAGASNQESPAKNRKNLARTKRRQSDAERTQAELYAEAKQRGIAGRSKMSKGELAQALNR